jgi:hypothetical protein
LVVTVILVLLEVLEVLVLLEALVLLEHMYPKEQTVQTERLHLLAQTTTMLPPM